MLKRHKEQHRIENSGWLRAAVLGANDGIVSTTSLVLGVAAAHASHGNILVTAIAGLVAGAMSMATGEYVSVSSQADTEHATLEEERAEISQDYKREERELTAIHVRRGLDFSLAKNVAEQLMKHDALGAHARDELGLSAATSAKPLQAAVTSAASFAAGALLPVVAITIVPETHFVIAAAFAALIALAFLGGLAAKVGGARLIPGVVRVTFWSALAMGATFGVGTLFGTVT